jgi:hypothetical protein
MYGGDRGNRPGRARRRRRGAAHRGRASDRRPRHIRDDGTFTFRWIPKNKNIGRGTWTMVARMRCESGRDGSTIFVRATRRITIS